VKPKDKRKRISPFILIFLAAYAGFIIASLAAGFEFGITAGRNLLRFSKEMILILPAAFILIGLFEVWVPRSAIERHLGKDSGVLAYFWMLLLAGTTVGGIYIAFPVAYSLRQKGARLSVIFAYVGFAGVARIPMTLFELSVMGAAYTGIRLAVSIPLILLFSKLLGDYLEKKKYRIQNPDEGR
jgi:hypothetical protein